MLAKESIVERRHNDRMHEKFVCVATLLSNQFPDLDLRFNLTSGSSTVRFQVATVSDQIFELDLESNESTFLVHNAILSIKEVARLFDS